MGYTNSPLATYTLISPNSTNPRNHKIDTITIHHIAGVLSAKGIAELFTKPSRQASCNYAVGNEGDIALVVEEKNRSWCSSSRENDHRAITFEVSNSARDGEWPVSDAAIASVIALCADICKRNGKTRLTWNSDKEYVLSHDPEPEEMRLTMHNWFAATACPGPYLSSKYEYIAAEVNKLLVDEPVTPTPYYYRVRKSWEDARSQIGAYENFNNAVAVCDAAGEEYHVYDEEGNALYPEDTPIDTSYVDEGAADPEYIWNFLLAQGLTDAGAAGLMGNLYAESALRPCNLQQTFETTLGLSDAEYTAMVDAGVYDNFVRDGAGYGLAQWTYWSRKQAMLKFHQVAATSIHDLDTQLNFLIQEIKNYKNVWEVLTTTDDVVAASNIVLLEYEQPGDMGIAQQQRRQEYSFGYYNEFATIEEEQGHEVEAPVEPEAPVETEPEVNIEVNTDDESINLLSKILKIIIDFIINLFKSEN